MFKHMFGMVKALWTVESDDWSLPTKIGLTIATPLIYPVSWAAGWWLGFVGGVKNVRK